MRLVELDECVAGQGVQRLRRRRHPCRRVIAEQRAVEALLREEARLRPLVDKARPRPRLVTIDLSLRKRRVHHHVRHQRKEGIQVGGQAAARNLPESRRDPGPDVDRSGQPIELLRDLLGRLGRAALAHQGGGERGQPRRRPRIIVAARAVDEQREEDLRRAMILDNDEVNAVREVRLLRLGQLDLQDFLVDRRLALQDRARLLGRVALLAHRRSLGGEHAAERNGEDGGTQALHCAPPLAGAAAGMVITTERFSLVKYFLATRCTSAAVTFL